MNCTVESIKEGLRKDMDMSTYQNIFLLKFPISFDLFLTKNYQMFEQLVIIIQYLEKRKKETKTAKWLLAFSDNHFVPFKEFMQISARSFEHWSMVWWIFSSPVVHIWKALIMILLLILPEKVLWIAVWTVCCLEELQYWLATSPSFCANERVLPEWIKAESQTIMTRSARPARRWTPDSVLGRCAMVTRSSESFIISSWQQRPTNDQMRKTWALKIAGTCINIKTFQKRILVTETSCSCWYKYNSTLWSWQPNQPINWSRNLDSL